MNPLVGYHDAAQHKIVIKHRADIKMCCQNVSGLSDKCLIL